MATAAVLAATKSVVQPMRGGSVRADVQSAGPKSILTGGLGTEHRFLQGSQGECFFFTCIYCEVIA